MAKNKFYVVWKGLNPGIYDNWAECKAQVDGQEGAKYKSFENREEAAKAFEAGYTHYLKTASSPKAVARLAPEAPIGNPINESLAVDAACSGNPGDMEYRGVYTATGQEIFHIGPLKEGTNNVGEFLALVHGLALLQQKGSDLPIYSDSRNAISWVKKKKCKTLLARIPPRSSNGKHPYGGRSRRISEGNEVKVIKIISYICPIYRIQAYEDRFRRKTDYA